MKLVIQIPCYNEEDNIERTINDLPTKIDGIQEIIILGIDDGSTDKTVEKLKASGVNHILKLNKNYGLGYAFQAGLDYAKKINADVLVNTDADNQYQGKYIIDMVQKLINNKLDIVIGARPISEIKNFSWLKKKLQKIGSFVVQKISRQKFSDATSGFRAYSKHAIQKINISSTFSYTLESLIQANDLNLSIGEVSINVNLPTRKSRLFKSNIQFIFQQGIIILRCFAIYNPMSSFLILATPFFFGGFLLILRFFLNYLSGGSGLIQSLIIGAMLTIVSVILTGLGILGEIIRHNRKIIEKQKLF